MQIKIIVVVVVVVESGLAKEFSLLNLGSKQRNSSGNR